MSLGERNRFMGASAKNQIVSNFKNTVWGWKKLLGRKFKDPIVQREIPLLPYEVVEMPNGSVGIKVCLFCFLPLLREISLDTCLIYLFN